MNLTPRLEKIASLVPRGSVLADVGTDHAYVPVHCVSEGICPRAIAMDINEGPLNNARDTVEKSKLSSVIELRLSDGLKKLKPKEADTVVIAGMGGLLIKSILEAAELEEGTTLILQPMLAQMELREYLYTNSMAVLGEYLAKEDSKIYNIIVARVGSNVAYTHEDILIGRGVSENSPELFGFYMDKEINVRKKILKGLSDARNPDREAIWRTTKELERWQKYAD